MIEIAFDKDPLHQGRVWADQQNPLRLARIRRTWCSAHDTGLSYEVWDRSDPKEPSYRAPWSTVITADATNFRAQYAYAPEWPENIDHEHQVAAYCLERAQEHVEDLLLDGLPGDAVSDTVRAAEGAVALLVKATRYEAAARLRVQEWEAMHSGSPEGAAPIGERLTAEEIAGLLPW